MVALGVDLLGQVEDVLGGARDLSRPHLRRQAPHEAQECPPEKRSEHDGGERAQLGLVQVPAGEGEARDQQRHGEPDAREGSTGDQQRRAQRRPRPVECRSRRDPRCGRYPHGLSDHVAGEDAERDRGGDRIFDQPRAQVHSGVRQREYRDDHIAGPRVQAVLDALVERDRGDHALLGRAGQLRRGLLAERAGQHGRALEVIAGRRVGAGGEPHREPRDDWIDARFEHRDP